LAYPHTAGTLYDCPACDGIDEWYVGDHGEAATDTDAADKYAAASR